FQQANRAASEARHIARTIGWRSGEAFAFMIMSMSLGAHGDYEEALEAAENSLRLAEEIEHLQWMVGAHIALGTIYLDLLALDSAQLHLSRALKLVEATGSKVWLGSGSAYLAHTLTATGAL